MFEERRKDMKRIPLDKVKYIEVEILKYVTSICEKNNLRYYLMAGTLLGAVRHGGFIPWDDDIDIGMPRPDYEKLKKVMGNAVFENRFKLLTYENGGTKYNFMKIVDDRTILYEKYMSEATGIWVDIFPIDGLPDSYFLTRILCYRLGFWRRLLNISMSKDGIATSKKRMLVKKIIRPLVRCFSTDFLCKKINSIFKDYNYDKCRYVGDVSGVFSYKARVPKEIFIKSQVIFEGDMYDAPEGRDALLTQLYGDYMSLPPVEKRVQHDFEAYWKE